MRAKSRNGRSVQRALEESREEWRFLSTRLLESQEEERRRLAAELHDNIAPFLGSVKFGLETIIAKQKEGPGEKEMLLTVVGMVKSIAGQLEHIRHALRPSMLDDLGFIESMDWYCGEFEEIYRHIRVKSSVLASERNIPEHLKIVLFRILQEALNNVAKHSEASLVHLSLISEADTFRLVIEDNGKGFESAALKRRRERIGRGFGLVSMQERVEATGGRFDLATSAGRGVRIEACWQGLLRKERRGHPAGA